MEHDFENHATLAYLPLHARTPDPVIPEEQPFVEALEIELAILEEHGRQDLLAGDPRSARGFFEKVILRRRTAFGEGDPLLIDSFLTLGTLAAREDKTAEAAWHFRQAKQIIEMRLGSNHPALAAVLNNLGAIASRQGSWSAAESLLRRSLELQQATTSESDAATARTMINLGNLALRRGDSTAALARFAAAREILEKCEGGTGPGLAAALLGLGRAHLSQGSIVAARFAFERALRIREAITCTPTQLAICQFSLGITLWPEDPNAALELVATALQTYEESRSCRPENLTLLHRWLAEHTPQTLKRAG